MTVIIEKVGVIIEKGGCHSVIIVIIGQTTDIYINNGTYNKLVNSNSDSSDVLTGSAIG